MCTIDADGVRHALLPGVNGTVRRQDMPPVYRANVAIYVNDAGEIDLDTSFNDNEVGFVMSAGRSVDIDDLEDFARAERGGLCAKAHDMVRTAGNEPIRYGAIGVNETKRG